MATFKNPTKHVRHLFYELLSQTNAIDTYYTAEQVADLCNHAGGFTNEEGKGINKAIVAQAWSIGNTSYDFVFRDVSGLEVEGTLYALVSHRFVSGGDCITALGRFASKEAEEKARLRLREGELTRLNFRLRDFESVPVKTKESFAKYVNGNNKAFKDKGESKK